MHQGNTNQRYGFDYINCRQEYHLGISKRPYRKKIDPFLRNNTRYY